MHLPCAFVRMNADYYGYNMDKRVQHNDQNQLPVYHQRSVALQETLNHAKHWLEQHQNECSLFVQYVDIPIDWCYQAQASTEVIDISQSSINEFLAASNISQQ
jgi:hypothetical protein